MPIAGRLARNCRVAGTKASPERLQRRFRDAGTCKNLCFYIVKRRFSKSRCFCNLLQFFNDFGWFLRQRSDFLDPQGRAVDSPGALGASLEHLPDALETLPDALGTCQGQFCLYQERFKGFHEQFLCKFEGLKARQRASNDDF